MNKTGHGEPHICGISDAQAISGSAAVILIVEDSATQAEMLRRTLVKAGYSVAIAKNGALGLAEVARLRPSLVISDIVMPEMDGFGLCRGIKTDENLRDIPVMLLTSLDNPTDVIHGLECGADNFITKPYDEGYLLSHIGRMLSLRGLPGIDKPEEGMEVCFAEQKYLIRSEPRKILDFLLSIYETAVKRNHEMLGMQEELRAWNEQLEQRVEERTAALMVEVAERKRGEGRLQNQFTRMALLNRITRAIAERQDIESIFRVVLRHLEDHLPVDFCSICDFDPTNRALTVSVVSAKGITLAADLDMRPGSVIPVDQNGLGRCVDGQTTYEPDSAVASAPFLQKFARAGLISVVATPLTLESEVRGVLISARSAQAAFSSGECEFLGQLSEHVALAINQTQMHARLQQAYDELRNTQQSMLQQERLRAMGQMASGIAHDINNALGPVALYAESLLDNEPNLSERTRRYLQTIQSASEDIAHTVARMREFYRKPEQQIALYSTDLNRLVKQVIELTRPRWKDMPQERGAVIEIAASLQPNLPALMSIESEIREALTNLILNAIDAMPEGGSLGMRTRSAAGRLIIEVSDSGIGMDEDTKCRCLEPFYTTKGERGTGLGLAMVYGVMKRHGGEIQIESECGKGTTVRLLFPLPAAGKTNDRVDSTAALKPAPLRILSIDDDPLMRQSLKETLENDGHKIEAAEDGERGLELFRTALQRGEPFDVVITDLGMPHMDGREVARRIKNEAPKTPVLLLTGWGMHMRAEGEIPAHVDHVLSKPPKLKEIREVLSKISG